MSSFSGVRALSDISERWFPPLGSRSSPYTQVSSRRNEDRFITKYAFPDGEVDLVDRAEEQVRALLDFHAELFPLFPPEELRALIVTREFLVINGNTVSFSSENYDIEGRYKDFFSEGLLRHPTTCPHGHHFELDNARRWVSQMGRTCPVFLDHSIGNLEEDTSLAREILEPSWRFTISKKFFSSRQSLLALAVRVNRIWLTVNSFIKNLWRKAYRLVYGVSPDNPFSHIPVPEDPRKVDDAYIILSIADRNTTDKDVEARRDFVLGNIRRRLPKASEPAREMCEQGISRITTACNTILASRRQSSNTHSGL